MNPLQWIHLAIAFGLVALFWIVPKKARLFVLAGAGMAGMAYLDWRSLLVLVASSLAVFALTRRGGKAGYAAAIATCCVTLLGYRAWQVAVAADTSTFVLLGCAFYLLRLAHYAIDSAAGKVRDHGLAIFIAYCFFWPTLTVGPVNRFDAFMRDDQRRRWDPRLFISGLERILFGYFKLVVLANYLLATKFLPFAQNLGGDDNALGAWLLNMHYGLDLYFRFGAFSDIAIGLSRLVGVRVMENFRWPYFQANIAEFWRSWHISVSGWCRDYVFSPIAFKLRQPAAGVVASMLILGIWHELSLRYVLWGLFHGVGIVVHRLWLAYVGPRIGGVPGWIRYGVGMVVTFNFVVLGYSLTRTDSLAEAGRVFVTILTLGG
ncbi:MAG: MBOAT family O-acyltransferase [Myxococcota bacterium]